MDVDENESTRKKRKLSDIVSLQIVQSSAMADKQIRMEGQLERGSTWMDDGNIIIQADRTQFRVHKSRLTHCSSVFKDMFSLPQPTDALYGGVCQVVHLHDSAEDVGHLMNALYEFKHSGDPTTIHDEMDIRVVSALLRLGNKYDIPHLRRSMLLRIHAEYPTSLKDVNFDDFTFVNGEKAAHIAIANLLHQEGIISALPLSLYFVSYTYTTEQLLDGVQRSDGTKVTLLPTLIGPCMLGKERLAKFMWDKSFKWLRDSASSAFCGQLSCRSVFFALEKEILCVVPELAYALEHSWQDILRFAKFSHLNLCGLCNGAAVKHHEEGRTAVFAALPSFFGYKSWDEVKQLDRYPL